MLNSQKNCCFLGLRVGTHGYERRLVDAKVIYKITKEKSPSKRAKYLASFVFTDYHLKDKSIKLDKCHKVRPGQAERTELTHAELCLYIRKSIHHFKFKYLYH